VQGVGRRNVGGAVSWRPPPKATRWIGVGFWACSFSRRSPFYSVWAGEMPRYRGRSHARDREQRTLYEHSAAWLRDQGICGVGNASLSAAPPISAEAKM
jgi:hypothetical protein